MRDVHITQDAKNALKKYLEIDKSKEGLLLFLDRLPLCPFIHPDTQAGKKEENAHISQAAKSALKKFLEDGLPIESLPDGIDLFPICPFVQDSLIKRIDRNLHVEPNEHIPIFVNQVHRNEQINIVALCAGHQIIVCENELNLGAYCLLLPMKGIKSPVKTETGTIDRVYGRNNDGKNFQQLITNKWGNELDSFPCKYIAVVEKRLRLTSMIENIRKFWQEIQQEGLFDFWDIESGPVQWAKDRGCQVYVSILRVYEVDEDLRYKVEYMQGWGRPPYFNDSPIEVRAVPVLHEDEFTEKVQKVKKIYNNPKYKINW